MPVGEEEGEGRRRKVCSQEGECALPMEEVLKDGSLEEVLGEDLNRIFISFVLMCQNEINSLNFLCP